MQWQWSKFQLDIFKAVAESDDSLIIEAVAGSGKSSTILEAVKHVPRGQTVLLLAFNKPIADALTAKLKTSAAKAMTLHSCGFSAWKSLAGADCKVNGQKVQQIIRGLPWEQRKRNPALAKLVGLAKQIGLVPGDRQEVVGEFYEPVVDGQLPDEIAASWGLRGLTSDTDDAWQGLMAEFDIEPEEADVRLARSVLRQSNELAATELDFDDMLYLPVVAGAPFKQYDVVFVDEAQDVNALQREMVARIKRRRVIAVGDRKQCIYAFRGASHDAMALTQRQFSCCALPLSITYRCPTAVVAEAQRWVPDIQAAPDAAAGSVTSPETYDIQRLEPTDLVLCRVTRPLVALAFHLIRSRVRCRIVGRDIGEGLVKLVERAKLPADATVERFVHWLDAWERKEQVKAADTPSKAAAIADKAATIRVFAAQLDDTAPVSRLVAEIQYLFQPDADWPALTLSTVHKAKGLEFDRVFVLDADKFMPPWWATDLQTELNLSYVAATRAKKELYYVTSGGLGVEG